MKLNHCNYLARLSLRSKIKAGDDNGYWEDKKFIFLHNLFYTLVFEYNGSSLYKKPI